MGAGPLTERFDEALLFASRHHRQQLRKGSQVPYMTHLMSVSALVMEHDGSEDQAIAALLHDAVEDAKAGTGGAVLAEIRSRFGDAVAEIVRACSDGLDADGNRSARWPSACRAARSPRRCSAPSMNCSPQPISSGAPTRIGRRDSTGGRPADE